MTATSTLTQLLNSGPPGPSRPNLYGALMEATTGCDEMEPRSTRKNFALQTLLLSVLLLDPGYRSWNRAGARCYPLGHSVAEAVDRATGGEPPVKRSTRGAVPRRERPEE